MRRSKAGCGWLCLLRLQPGASENKSRAGEVTGKWRALDLSTPGILTAHNERVPGTGMHTVQPAGPIRNKETDT
ncbi:hypothetical protein BKI51_11615 [Alphaproteobacteria bacterium AO1-B]|nr:hypothetical protein BKI51_11615 [Alphaproteobacteria bacterium AO1-B]